MGESAEVSNHRSWKYLTEFMLDVIRAQEGGTQEIPTPQKVDLWKYMRRQKQHRHLTASYSKQNPRVVPRSVPDSSDLVFGGSSGDPSVSPSDKTTIDPYPVPIINPEIVTSETTTKDTFHVTKEVPSANTSNMLSEYPR